MRNTYFSINVVGDMYRKSLFCIHVISSHRWWFFAKTQKRSQQLLHQPRIKRDSDPRFSAGRRLTMAKKPTNKSVESLTHEEATRKNIPTAEHQSIIQETICW